MRKLERLSHSEHEEISFAKAQFKLFSAVNLLKYKRFTRHKSPFTGKRVTDTG